MSWDVALADGKSFRSLAFAITDASDVGGFLRISVGGNDVEFRTGSKLPNSNVRLVTVDFDRPTSSAEIMLGNFTEAGGETPYLNDGFSIDGIQVAPVPLPPSVLLLGGALLGLGFVAHRRRRVLA
ncbi:hypothetical protein [Ruegeria sp.]|uniref:hypothetical protein n=1 Tax=Ruegeria sp. TaxID=1879320 RepID=UPI003B5960EC